MLVPGQHEALISEELYFMVQDVLDGKKRNVPTKNTMKEELPLRGFLICRKCGSNLTGSASRGKLGGRYFYYHCKNGCNERFSAKEANKIFVKGLANLTVKQKAIDLYYLGVKKAFNLNQGDKSQQTATIKREMEAIHQRIEKARDMMLDDKIDASDYKEIKMSLQPQIEKLNRKLIGFTQVDGNYRGFIEEGFSFLRNMAEAFDNADLRAKQQFVGSVFPEKLIFENNQYRTPKMLRAFARILSIDGAFKRAKKRTEEIFIPQSALVIPLGFEPRTLTLKV
ncbi:MAG: recombinase zinc beta ribbon domain-containing protein [Bacteroidetes bacterium]|nr:recombinase zinc beta ribbon domain-containing protein [Bacteroidota bacterium]